MNNASIRSLVYVALFSALFIVFSALQLKLAISPVPITLQTLAVILSGMFLKPRSAFLSIFIVILLGLIGLPVFGGKSGLAHILGPTGGFILYFPFGAAIISYLTSWAFKHEALQANKALKTIFFLVIFIVFSSVMAYIVGVPWFMSVLDVSVQKALTLACYPYLIGDTLKAIVGLIILLVLSPTIAKIRTAQ